MTARLAAHVEVSGLIRRVEGLGGTGMVLARGDREAGAILLILADRGTVRMVLERALDPSGVYRWRGSGAKALEEQGNFDDLIARRRRLDPDIWVLELDIAGAEQFGAEMIASG